MRNQNCYSNKSIQVGSQLSPIKSHDRHLLFRVALALLASCLHIMEGGTQKNLKIVAESASALRLCSTAVVRPCSISGIPNEVLSFDVVNTFLCRAHRHH
jgi:hypothetical protein